MLGRRLGVAKLLLVGALATANTGCADISMRTKNTHTEIISRHQKVVSGRSVRVRSRIDGTTLFLQTNQGCDLVEMEEVRVTQERVPDEDLTEEFTVLGLSTLPLTTGIIMLVDAPNVHDTDRNSPSYNPIGKEGAYAGGTVLTAVGGILALVPIIELMRVAAAGEETESTSSRQGSTVTSNVTCEGGARAIRTSVTLRVGNHNLSTKGTDHNGHLELDLAKAIPHEIAKKAVTVQVIVAGKVVGELDIQPILDAQVENQREQEAGAWQQVDRNRCETAPQSDSGACASVRAFLKRFPDGLHADEARTMIEGREDSGPVIATDGEEGTDGSDGKTDDSKTDTKATPDPDWSKAKDDAKKQQKRACKISCLNSCKKSHQGAAAAKCVESCVKEVCK